MFDLMRPIDLAIVLGPDLLLIVGSMVLLIWAAWRPDSASHSRAVGLASIGLVTLVLALVVYYAVTGVRAGPGLVAADGFRWLADGILLLATIGTLALSLDYNRREGILAGEAHVLVLFATAGMMLLAAARDLMIVFIGIELMSITVYVLAGLNRRSAKSAEGSLKYFLLGAFATAFLLYGIALIYGATGSVNFEVMGARIVQAGLPVDAMLVIGVALLMIGFGFKIAAAPFHMWAPDVYEGAPTPISAYMAAAVKAAAFVALLRVFREAFLPISNVWYEPLWWLAAATMVVGNVTALLQKNIKRMLAYSSIAHAGYILVAVAAGSTYGSWALLFYSLAYTLATLGAFAVVSALSSAGEPNLEISDYSGIWRTRPGTAVAMTIFMFALLGFPVVGGIGFIGKWALVSASQASPLPGGTSLAVILVLTSAVSAGYYLYVVRVMFMGERSQLLPTPARAPLATRIVIGTTAVLIVLFGLFPGQLLQLAREGALSPPGHMTVASPPGAASQTITR